MNLKPLAILPLFLSVLLGGVAWATGFGDDVRTAPPWKLPYRCLAKVALPGGWGSGVLIGPDLCLTCGHCVIDPASGKPLSDVEVIMGYGEHLKLEGAAVDLWWPQPTDFEPGSGKDCAIVRLNRPLGLYYGWLGCQEKTPSELLNQKIEFIGYGNNPTEKRSEFAAGAAPFVSPGVVRETTERVFGHDCSGWLGSSGGALLSVSEEPQVLGIFAAAVGPGQDAGFLPSYRPQEAGNVGVPTRGWAELLKRIPPKQYEPLRRIEARNSKRVAVAVRLRYKSVWKDEEITGTPVVIAPGQKEAVISLEDGFNDQEVLMETQNLARSDSGKLDIATSPDKWSPPKRCFLGRSGDHVLFVR